MQATVSTCYCHERMLQFANSLKQIHRVHPQTRTLQLHTVQCSASEELVRNSSTFHEQTKAWQKDKDAATGSLSHTQPHTNTQKHAHIHTQSYTRNQVILEAQFTVVHTSRSITSPSRTVTLLRATSDVLHQKKKQHKTLQPEMQATVSTCYCHERMLQFANSLKQIHRVHPQTRTLQLHTVQCSASEELVRNSSTFHEQTKAWQKDKDAATGSLSHTQPHTNTQKHAHIHTQSYTRNHIGTQKLLCVSSVALRQMHHVNDLYKLVSCPRTLKNKREVHHILLLQNINQHLLQVAVQILLPTVNNLSKTCTMAIACKHA